MPAKDRFHDIVITALVKEGWQITAQQVAVIVENRRLWIDLRAESVTQDVAILVEIKGFENTPSPDEYLANATGKYALYRAVLDYLNIPLPLYMAVPTAAHRGILSEEIAKQTLQRSGVKLIVFDPEREEIVQWID